MVGQIIKIPGTESHLLLDSENQGLDELCLLIHTFNRQWWRDPETDEPKTRNMGEMLMLMTSELAEALEADRKNLMDDKLPQFHGIDVELVDCIIRIFDVLGSRQAPVAKIFDAKCKFNSERADHKPENRLLADGKKY